MIPILGGIEVIESFFLDKKWIVFQFEKDKFATFLEENYFTPGTKMNGEFEVFMGRMFGGLGFFYRIKDTSFNRSNFRKAMEEFHNKRLSDDWEITLEKMRNNLMKQVRVYIKDLKKKGIK